MNKLRITFSLLTILMFCPMHKGMAQHTEALSDSLVYAIAMYQELYKEYRKVREDHMLDCSAMVAEFFGKVASAEDFTNDDFNRGVVNLNTNLVKDLGADLLSILDLSETIKQKLGITISEEQAVGLSTVRDIYEIARANDTIMLAMACYPWRMVFDSRSVHRISLYEDGIDMLTDLTTLTTDSIQRDIYFNELMNIYDVWYEYADTINELVDIPISKTQIKCDKARKFYIECMPKVYGMHRDSITKENIMAPYAVRAYDLFYDALYEQENKEDLDSNVPTFFFKLSQCRIAHYHENKNIQAFADQYKTNFDTIDSRICHLLALNDLRKNVQGSINKNYEAIKNTYRKTIRDMGLIDATNWREKEPIFREQLEEKSFLWICGQEEPDATFLEEIILHLGNDSSDVYVEALELYIEYFVPRPAKGESFRGDKEDYVGKRKALFGAYYNRKRFDDCISIIDGLIAVEQDDERAYWEYQKGYIYLKQYEIATKANKRNEANNMINKAAYRFKAAISRKPDYGDAYYQLAYAYARITYDPNNRDLDSFRYLLCQDKCKEALRCLKNSVGKDSEKKFNRIVTEEEVNKLIKWSNDNMPDMVPIWHSLGISSGEKYKFKDQGVWKGESVTRP